MTNPLSLEEASALIGLVYDSALEKHQWIGLTVRLMELCPGHVCAVTSFEDDAWQSSHAATLPEGEHGDQIQDVMDAAESGALDQPPDLHEVMFRRQPLELGTIYSTRQLFSEDEFRGFAAYKTTMAPIGAGHYAGVHFSISEGRRAALMVVENDFAKVDKDHARVCAILELLSPHIIRAARFARALTLAKEAASTYAGFMDAIALPLIVVTSDGQMQMANSMGQKLMDAGHIVQVAQSGRLRFQDQQDTKALYETIAALQDHSGPQSLQVAVADTLVAACICPFKPALSEASGVDRKIFADTQLFAVFIGARPDGGISLNLLGDAFALTPREAEVCGHLLNGSSPSRIASDTGRAEKTVRNQIQSVYEKVGVTTNRDLVEALSVFRNVGAMYEAANDPVQAPLAI